MCWPDLDLDLDLDQAAQDMLGPVACVLCGVGKISARCSPLNPDWLLACWLDVTPL